MSRPVSAQVRNPLAWSAAGYAAFFVETVVGVAISILTVRTLSVTEFGAYKLAGSIIMVGSYLTSCGLEATLQRFGAEMVARERHGALRSLLLYVRVVRAVALLAFCGILLAARGPVSAFFAFPPVLTDALVLVCAILVVQSANSINGYSFFSARGAYVEMSALRATVALLKLAGFTVAFLAGLGLVGVLGALFLAPALGLAWILWRNHQWLAAHRPAATVIAEIAADDYRGRILRYSLIGYLAINVNVFRDLSVDSFVIAHFLGPEQVAMYGLAATLILFANALNPATLLRSVLTPLLTARHATGGGQPELLRAFRLLNKMVMLLHWPLVTLLLVLGTEVIRLVYTPAYVPAYGPLAVLAGFGFFLGLTYPFVPLIAVLEKNVLLLFSGLTSVYNLALDVLLVPRWGIAGAALATGSAAVLQLALYWFAFRRVFSVPLSFPFAVAGRTALNLAAPVAVALLLKEQVANVMQLLLLIAGCGLLYGLAVFFNHGLEADELRLFDGLRRRARG
ncbi:MAG: succinoglycan biosynthesis protein ExoP [Gammaproteobacteria bacterium]|nr:MAG: succinoglycan biosynthesis protein ExoP [Gammaproteobacteria bacterium]